MRLYLAWIIALFTSCGAVEIYAGSGFTVSDESAPTSSSFESIRHYRNLHWGSTILGQVGWNSVSPSGIWAMAEMDGQIKLIHQGELIWSRKLVNTKPKDADWSEADHLVLIHWYNGSDEYFTLHGKGESP